jgi:hypothetical protein
MTRPLIGVALVLILLSGASGDAAQERPAAEPPQSSGPVVVPPQPARSLVPLEVQVVISRHQGDKKVSSMPYVLAVNANSGNSQLEMGAEVPVQTVGSQGESASRVASFSYQNIGTSIDCQARTADEGRYELTIAVDEKSVLAGTDQTQVTVARDMPVFRSFRSRNRLLLKSGQTRQYTAATDRVNGETVRIDVTLKVLD